jgi:hypothetical protein
VDHLIRDGEAAYLEVGTEFHAIVGRNPETAIAVVFNDQRVIFAPDAMLTAQLVEAQRPSSDVLDVPGDAATAEVCKAETIVDLPDTNCKQLGGDGVSGLVAALDGAAPFGVGEPCGKGEGRVYKVVLHEATGRKREFVISTPCGPLTEGARRYRVSEDLSRALIREHDEASPEPSD